MRAICRFAAVFLLAFGGWSLPLVVLAQEHNGVTVKKYEEMAAASSATDPGAENALNWYLDGVVTGLAWSFIDGWNATKSHFFCSTNGLRLARAEHLRTLIAAELAANGDHWRRRPEAPIEQVAIQALKRLHPCPAR